MARQKSERRACVYVADTECTTNVDYEEDGHVYAYIMHLESVRTASISGDNATILPEEITFSGPGTMEQFVDSFVEKIPVSAKLWFYNTRYDCQFIMDYLMKNRGYVSYSWEEKEARKEEIKKTKREYIRNHPEARRTITFSSDFSIVRENPEKVPNAVLSQFVKKRVIQPIRSGSRLIQLDIFNSKGHKLSIMDVGNKFTNLPQWNKKENRPMSGVEAIANMFGMEKAPLDVLKYRGDGYEPNEEEITRCVTDVKPIRLAMEKMYSIGLEQSTLAGDAWKIYSAIRHIGIGIGDDKTGKKHDLLAKLGITIEDRSLPEDGILDDMEEKWLFKADGVTVDVRDAYRGGVTFTNPKYQNQKLRTRKGRRIAHDDCNSMHPASMVCPMPYGQPERSRGAPTKDFYIMQCYCKFKIKKGRWPVICNNANGIDGAEWLYEGEQTLCLTCYDWKWVKKNYDIEIIGEKYYLNWDTRVNESVEKYVEHFIAEKSKWKKQKEDSDPVKRLEGEVMYYVSKILMNALYGKFGQDPVKPYEWCKVNGETVGYGKSKVALGEFDDNQFHKYLPMACAITGCSRDRLWTHIDKLGYENFIYADTDSEFFWTECETNEELVAYMTSRGIEIHPTKLGAWDIEHGLKEGEKIVEAKFVRAKVYGIVQENEEITIKTAGLPIEARKKIRNLDEMYIGAVFVGAKKVPVNVPGGQILTAKDFTLKDH